MATIYILRMVVKILIARVYPPEDLWIIGTIYLENTSINGLYIYNNKLVVLTYRDGFFFIMDIVLERDTAKPAVVPELAAWKPFSNI